MRKVVNVVVFVLTIFLCYISRHLFVTIIPGLIIGIVFFASANYWLGKHHFD